MPLSKAILAADFQLSDSHSSGWTHGLLQELSSLRYSLLPVSGSATLIAIDSGLVQQEVLRFSQRPCSLVRARGVFLPNWDHLARDHLVHIQALVFETSWITFGLQFYSSR